MLHTSVPFYPLRCSILPVKNTSVSQYPTLRTPLTPLNTSVEVFTCVQTRPNAFLSGQILNVSIQILNNSVTF